MKRASLKRRNQSGDPVPAARCARRLIRDSHRRCMLHRLHGLRAFAFEGFRLIPSPYVIPLSGIFLMPRVSWCAPYPQLRHGAFPGFKNNHHCVKLAAFGKPRVSRYDPFAKTQHHVIFTCHAVFLLLAFPSRSILDSKL